MLKNVCLNLVGIVFAIYSQAQVLTDEIKVSFGELVRLQYEGANKLIVGDDVQIIGNLGVNNADPEKTLDVSGSGRITGHLNAGSIETGGGYWKSQTKVWSGGIDKQNDWRTLVDYGHINHARAFRILVRYSNNHNHNHNYVSEVMGICRHRSFSGSAISEVDRVSTYLGVNGEIASAGYRIESDPARNSCRIEVNLNMRGTNQTAFYVLKLETL